MSATIRLGANGVVLLAPEARTEEEWFRKEHGPAPIDPRDRMFAGSPITRAGVLAAPSLAGIIDFAAPFWTPRIQRAQDCVGYDLAQDVEVELKIEARAGLRPADSVFFPSPLLIYTCARLDGERDLARQPGDPLLVDWGSNCRWARRAAKETGLVPEALWEESPERINMVPKGHVWQEGACLSLRAFYRIHNGDEAKRLGEPPPSAQIVAAMMRGKVVGFCMVVDEKYVAIGKATYDSPGGAVIGGHAQSILIADTKSRRVGVASTWGTQFGDDGIFWISFDFIDAYASDMWVTEHGPIEV